MSPPQQLYSNQDELRPINSLVAQKIVQKLQINPEKILEFPQKSIDQLRKKLGYGDWDSSWHSLISQLPNDSPMTCLEILNLLETTRNYKPDRINLSSFHSAKGTEFKYVFIIEDGIRLNNESLESCARRLYVGFTRAKEELYILVNTTKATYYSGFEIGLHPILTIPNLQSNTVDSNSMPKEINYQVILEPKDLYLTGPAILRNQDKIEIYAQKGGKLYFRSKFFNSNNNICSAVAVLSKQGEKEISKLINNNSKTFSAHGHTIFRVERDDKYYRRAGVKSDVTHHYIVLPRLEIQETID